MPNGGQATLKGNVFFIECNEYWNCCQREQAQYKARAMNKRIGSGKIMRSTDQMNATRNYSPGDLSGDLRATMNESYSGQQKSLNDWKDACQTKHNEDFDSKTPEQRAQDAKDAGAAPCLVEQIRQGRTRQFGNVPPPGPHAGLQMDHPLDSKLGGDPVCKLIPLDANVNNMFGVRGQSIEKMATEGRTIKGVALICPPEPPEGGCKPPHDGGKGKSFNAGTKHGRSFPSAEDRPFVTPPKPLNA
jgi:hypothetical protein